MKKISIIIFFLSFLGSFPLEFTKLRNLEKCVVSYSNLIGDIPIEVGDMPNFLDCEISYPNSQTSFIYLKNFYS